MTDKDKKEPALTADSSTKSKTKKEPEVNALAVSGDIAGPLASPDQIRAAGALLTARLKAMIDVISANLIEDQDYGSITIKDAQGREHETKKTLFKSGSEKVMALFNWRAHFSVDEETRKQLPPTATIFCYLCQLLDRNGNIIGEGRGACSMSESRDNANNAIKKAQKRAQVDAVLRASIMSYFFTQDIEDESEPDPKTGKPVYQSSGKISEAQQRFLFSLMRQNNVSKETVEKFLLEKHKVIGIENTPKQLASQIIDNLVKKYPPKTGVAQPKEDIPTVNLDEANNENGEL